MNFVKKKKKKKNSKFDNVVHFLRIFALGPFFADQIEFTPPPIFLFFM